MQVMRAAALWIFATTGPALAQDQIDPDTFLDQLAGKTATFNVWQSGDLVGVEQFLRRDRTVWARSDGSCAYGTVTVRDVLVCFVYDDESTGRAHCWIPFVSDEGTLLVLDDDGSEVQEVTKITDTPVACNPPPTS